MNIIIIIIILIIIINQHYYHHLHVALYKVRRISWMIFLSIMLECWLTVYCTLFFFQFISAIRGWFHNKYIYKTVSDWSTPALTGSPVAGMAWNSPQNQQSFSSFSFLLYLADSVDCKVYPTWTSEHKRLQTRPVTKNIITAQHSNLLVIMITNSHIHMYEYIHTHSHIHSTVLTVIFRRNNYKKHLMMSLGYDNDLPVRYDFMWLC